jgi:hypothetical protein
MTKYTVASQQRRPVNAPPQVKPIWRGIGCIMMIVVPVVSFLLAVFTVNLAVAQDWPMPYQLMGYPVMPPLLSKPAALVPVVTFIQSQLNLYAILLFTVAYIVVIGAIVSFIYAFAYRYVGPPRYGPLDAEPPNRRVKRYKR